MSDVSTPMTFKDIEEQAKNELLEEHIEEKKEILKERIREIEHCERTLKSLKTQYRALLDKEIAEVHVCDC